LRHLLMQMGSVNGSRTTNHGRLQMLPGQFDDFGKGVGITDGEFGQGFSIQFDHGALEPSNKLAVAQAAHAAGGADARNPQPPESSFADAAIAESIHPPAHQSHEGLPIEVMPAETKAFR